MPNTDHYIGVVISDVARLLRTAFDRRVRRLGITRAQWLVLTRLHRRPGASLSELAEMMEVEKATAGRMIDRLVANGWVERRTEASDRRVKRVYLTSDELLAGITDFGFDEDAVYNMLQNPAAVPASASALKQQQ